MKTLKTILLLFSIMLFNTLQAADYAPCGVDYTQTDIQITPNSTEMCEFDLSKIMLNLIWGKIILKDDIKYFMTPNPEIPRNIEIMAVTGDISSNLVGVVEATSYLLFILASLFLTAKTMMVVVGVAKGNGESMEGGSKQSGTYIRQLIAFMFLAPVYGVSFAVLLVIKAGFIGAMLGNYFFSNVLDMQVMKSTKVDIDDSILYYESDIPANEISKSALSITRTEQQILNQNFTMASYFNEDYQDGDTGSSFDDFAEKIRECMSPYVKRTLNKEGLIDGFLLQSPDKGYCLEEFSENVVGETYDAISGYIASHKNDPNTYGQPHVISKISYETPQFEQLFHDQDGVMNNISQTLTNEDDVAGTSQDLIEKYQTNSYFRPFKEGVYSSIYDLIDTDEKEFKVAEEAFIKKIALKSEDLANQIYNDISNTNNISNKNEIFKTNAIYAKALSIYNSLLGLNEIGDNDQYRLDNTQEHKYGYLYLLDEGKLAADYIEQAHCAKNLINLTQSLRTQIGLTNLLIDPTNEDLVETVMLDQIPSRNFECLKISGTEYNDPKSVEEYEFKYNIQSTSLNPLSIFKLGTDTEREIFGFNDIYTTFEMKSFDSNEVKRQFYNDLRSKMDKHYLESVREANKHKLALKAYTFYVKRATLTALGKAFKENADIEMLVELRQLGWASAGAFLVKLSMSGGNASKMATSVMSSFDITSYGDSSTYVNPMALLSKTVVDKEQDKENNQAGVIQLLPFISNGFFMSGQNSYNKSAEIETDIELDKRSQGYIESWVQEALFSSFNYLKQSNGFDVNLTMQEGIEACKNGTGLCIGDVSPLAGLMQSGNSLIETAIQFYMLTATVNIMNSALNDESEGLMNVLKKLGGGVVAIIKLAVGALVGFMASILEAISPLFPIMLAVGFWCSYILPSIPLLLYSLGALSWLLLIVITTFVFTVQLLKAIIVDNETHNTLSFKFFWEVFATIISKPPLMVISITIVYALYDITIFYINSVYGYFISATSSAGFILGIFSSVLFLLFYLVIVVFLISYSSFQIPKIVDTILDQIGLRGSNDSQEIVNLGVVKFAETYMQSAVAKNIGKAAQTGINSATKRSSDYFTTIREVEKKKKAEEAKKAKKEEAKTNNDNVDKKEKE